MTSASQATIEVQEVSKWYGSVVAVNEVSFEVYPGVTGLLGPNGAGKTTLLSMMAGLVRPSQGSMKVLGQSARNNPEVYRRIGIMQEHDAVYPFMTGREFVRLAASLQGVNENDAVEKRHLRGESAGCAEPPYPDVLPWDAAAHTRGGHVGA